MYPIKFINRGGIHMVFFIILAGILIWFVPFLTVGWSTDHLNLFGQIWVWFPAYCYILFILVAPFFRENIKKILSDESNEIRNADENVIN